MGSFLIRSVLIEIFLPLAIKVIEKYVKSTETKKDDDILQLIKLSFCNISKKNITNIDDYKLSIIDNSFIRVFQKPKV